MSAPSRTPRHAACPGVLATHHAADGHLVRIRLPGGYLTHSALAALADTATHHGSPGIDLTRRANLQLRGLAQPALPAVTTNLTNLGLFPSPTHDATRNFATTVPDASPTPHARHAAMTPWRLTAHLDAAWCAEPSLTAIPGKFWVAITYTPHSVPADIVIAQPPPGGPTTTPIVHAPGTALAWRAPDPIAQTIALATTFATLPSVHSGRSWRITELAPTDLATLDEGTPTTAGATRLDRPPTVPAPPPRPPFGVTRGPWGWVLHVAPRLGRLTTNNALELAQLADHTRPLRITTWQSVIVPLPTHTVPTAYTTDPTRTHPADGIAPNGMITADTDPWATVSACSSTGECARATGDARATATAHASSGTATGRLHIVACPRACGRPHDPHQLVLTTTAHATPTAPHPN